MLHKTENILIFKPKRNKRLITPCCKKSNRDGKFANYKGYSDKYGYCHSCGLSTLPPSIYEDEKGNEFIWNVLLKCFEPLNTQLYDNSVTQLYDNSVTQLYDNGVTHNKLRDKCNSNKIKYIDNQVVEKFQSKLPENNMLCYMRKKYGDKGTDIVKAMYQVGTSKDGGTVFWNINAKGKVQKAKVSYYKPDGKRTDCFKVPYKNDDGYYSCLFGEHLINKPENIDKSLILVESNKTAMVCAMHFPKYVWLSYEGINGLTKKKSKVLVGRNLLIVPDMSENAVRIINDKLIYLKEIGVDAKIWDMTNGMSDEELKEAGWYNCDLEDVFRTFI